MFWIALYFKFKFLLDLAARDIFGAIKDFIIAKILGG
jgi:hypothetical protein